CWRSAIAMSRRLPRTEPQTRSTDERPGRSEAEPRPEGRVGARFGEGDMRELRDFRGDQRGRPMSAPGEAKLSQGPKGASGRDSGRATTGTVAADWAAEEAER